MSLLIILNKKLIDYNVVGYMIRYALNMSSWLILVCSIFIMPLILSGSGYLIAFCIVFPSWCSVSKEVRDFNRALESDISADKWMLEHLNPDSVCLDYLIFAKNYNLLSADEFAMQINPYIKSANLIVSSEFIPFIELHQELKVSNE